jgi:hypothetical protein
MNPVSENWTKVTTKLTLLSINIQGNSVILTYYYDGAIGSTVLRNPEVLNGKLITEAEFTVNLYYSGNEKSILREAELVLNENDFLPEELCGMLGSQPPVLSTFFGILSSPEDGRGRYYMLRDRDSEGLLLCTGEYTTENGKGFCRNPDRQWPLRYNMLENFFYWADRTESGISDWEHESITLLKIKEEIKFKDLTKKFRDYAAGWHKYNFFSTRDWSIKFYRKQARLGYIAITHNFDEGLKLTPQLQREYAVLDWDNLVTDKKVKKIIESGRIVSENIQLHINSNPSIALDHLGKAWKPTWITKEYEDLIKKLAAECNAKKYCNFRILGVTLTAEDDDKVIAGELGYSIGKTYTSLSGFFHREEKKHNNFGKLQMVLLAQRLQMAGIEFWNLGQPYMDYKIKLGAAVVPRGLFLKRWDKAVKGKTPDLLID